MKPPFVYNPLSDALAGLEWDVPSHEAVVIDENLPSDEPPSWVRQEVPESVRMAHMRALHPAGQRGMVSVLVPELIGTNTKGKDQWRFRTSDIAPADLPTHPDVARARFVSANTFNTGRSNSSLKTINAIWLDADYYRDELKDFPPDEAAGIALERLDHAGVPRPSLILYSGRGLLFMWLINPVSGSAFRRWKACMDALSGPRTKKRGAEIVVSGRRIERSEREMANLARFEQVWQGFGIDHRVKDPARVFRIAGSRNEKSGVNVRLVYPASWTDVTRHDFDDLCDKILPYTRAEMTEIRARRHAGYLIREAARQERRAEAERLGLPVPTQARRAFNGSWHQRVIDDLHRMREHWGGTVPDGRRNMWLFLMAVHVAWVSGGDSESWVATYAAQAGFTDEQERREAMAALGSVDRRLRASRAGQTITFANQERDPRYLYKAETIIDKLGISPVEAEAANLRVLVPGGACAMTPTERSEARRRREGAVPRSGIQAMRLTVGHDILRMREAGQTIAQIAKTLAKSRTWVYKAMNQALSANAINAGQTGGAAKAIAAVPTDGPAGTCKGGVRGSARTIVDVIPGAAHAAPDEVIDPVLSEPTTDYSQQDTFAGLFKPAFLLARPRQQLGNQAPRGTMVAHVAPSGDCSGGNQTGVGGIASKSPRSEERGVGVWVPKIPCGSIFFKFPVGHRSTVAFTVRLPKPAATMVTRA